MPANEGIHPSDSWEYCAAAGAHSLSRTSRGILVNGGGDLYAHPGDASVNAEVQVGADILPGTLIPIQTDKIGASTTCTKMSVFHN